MIIVVQNPIRLKISPELIKKTKLNKAKFLFVIIVFVLAALPSYYFYNRYQQAQNLLQNPTQATDVQAQNLINAVGKLMVLPANEKPTVATVSDISKLVDQPFFANAKNGDKVLIYTQSKEAILYRENINKIVAVAPVNLGSGVRPSPAASVSQPTPTPVPVKAVIYNGTTTTGLANTAEQKISASITNVNILGKKDASNNYSKTIVIDLSGNQSQTATQIASLLGGKVALSVPQGETKPNADILVILGTDFNK